MNNEDNNPYVAPTSDVSEAIEGNSELASRWVRLGAAIIDMVLGMILAFPFVWLGYAEVSDSELPIWVINNAWLFDNELFFTIFALIYTSIGFLIFHGVLLARHGQTVGKRLVGIRIVDFNSNEIPPFGKLIGLRYIPVWLVGSIPAVGGILTTVDVLFIFSKDKRCVHDHLAGTKVINC